MEDLRALARQQAGELVEEALKQPTVGEAKRYMKKHEPDWTAEKTGTIEGGIQALQLSIWNDAWKALNKELDLVKLNVQA